MRGGRGGGGGRRRGRGGNRSIRLGLGALVGSRFGRDHEGRGCQEEAEGETGQMFPEKNCPFSCGATV